MKVAVVALLLLLTSCAARTYRVCHTGEYTGDVVCWKPQPKAAATAEAKGKPKDWVEPNRDGDSPMIMRVHGEPRK